MFTTNYSLDYADENAETACLLVAEEILTANVLYYDYSSNTRTIDGKIVYQNNYKYSKIRAYLTGSDYYDDSITAVDTYRNKGFLQTAFTSTAQNKIKTTKVRNDGLSTTDAGKNLKRADGYNGDGITSSGKPDYTCAATEDKIFLLSEYEVSNPDYGMPGKDSYLGNTAGENLNDGTRIKKATDYAKANYAYQFTISEDYGGYWLLRSPSYYMYSYVRNVYYSGYSDDFHYFYETSSIGIVPALCISFQ